MADATAEPILSGVIGSRGRRGKSPVRIGLVAVFFAAIVFQFAGPLSTAVVRNGCALEQARDRQAPCGLLDGVGGRARSSAGDRLVFRSALFAGRWDIARQLAPRVMSTPGRMGEALLIGEANRRTARGDPAAARSALDAVLDPGSRDPLVWYSAGQVYEKAGGLDRAEHCYTRGIAAEQSAEWAAGRYYLGVLYFKQGRWPRVVETLEPLTTGSIEWRIRNPGEDALSRLADWAGGFLLLGMAQEHTGRTDDAKQLYRRLLAAQVGSGEWKVNRALVYLAVLEGRDGASLQALQHFSRALDLTLTYPAAFGEEYQSDTWKQLLELVRRAPGDRWLPAAGAAVDAMPDSAGARLILALTRTAGCQDEAVDQAYRQAEALDRRIRLFKPRLEEARVSLNSPSCRSR